MLTNLTNRAAEDRFIQNKQHVKQQMLASKMVKFGFELANGNTNVF